MNNINVQKLSKVIWLHPWLCLESFWILWYCRFVPVPRWKNWSPYSTVQSGAQNSGLWWVSFWYFHWSVRKPSRYLLWRFYGTSSKAQLMVRDVLTLETVSYRIQLGYNAVKLCLACAETGGDPNWVLYLCQVLQKIVQFCSLIAAWSASWRLFIGDTL